MASFDENGNYIKTDWKAGDKITATKLNKIEESIEAVNSNDISRHVEADARLDALESSSVSNKSELQANIDALEDTVVANKDELDLDIYRIDQHMTLLDKKIDDGVAEVNAVAETVDGKIATAEANMTSAVNQGKADMEAMVAEVEGDLEGLHAKDEELSEQLAENTNYKNNLLNIFEYNKCDDAICNGNCGKVKGDGIHDDTLGLQNAIDYCWDNNIGGVYLPIPIEHYTTTSPLHLWSSSSESVRKKVALVGDGKELTKIVKTTNTCSNLNHHTNIDAVLIIVNDYIKEGNLLETEIDTSGLGICRYNEVSGISLSCASSTNRVKYGVYSVGWFFARFKDVRFENVDTGMNTLTWNCYSTYDRLRFDRTLNGCDFGTSIIGGQTTMLFQDCHANGLNGCVFNIRGNATFINCAIDGGGGTHYKAQASYRSNIGWGSAKIVLINCHHESPSVFADNHLFDLIHAEAYVYTSAMEIPTYNFTSASSVIKLSKGSTFVLHDTNISFRLDVESCPGMLVDKDETSQFILNNSFVDTEMFDVYKHCVYNESDCIVLSNRVIDTPMIKGVGYITGTVPVEDIPKPSINKTDTRLVLSSSSNDNVSVSYTALYIFTKKVDLTNMSKINIRGDIDFGEESGTTSANFQIYLFDTIPEADDFCYRGTPMPSYKIYITHDYDDYTINSANYSKENANRFVDITDVIGEYHIGIAIYGRNATASIKEVKIIR